MLSNATFLKGQRSRLAVQLEASPHFLTSVLVSGQTHTVVLHCRVRQNQHNLTWTRTCLRLAAYSSPSQVAHLTANQQGQHHQPCQTRQMSV